METVEEEVTSCTPRIYRNVEGFIETENGNILIQNKNSSWNLHTVPVCPEITQIFGYNITEEIQKQQLYENEKRSGATANKWTRTATLTLIDLFEQYRQQFKSTTIKNDKVYEAIVKDLQTNGFCYSSAQCKDKLKYLKMRYMKKKDNMKRSGAAPISFEFFEEMDKILGQKPNVTPVAIASSSRENDFEAADENSANMLEDTPETQSAAKKKSKTETKAQAAERRHQEKLSMQKEAIQSFETMMGRLLEKL